MNSTEEGWVDTPIHLASEDLLLIAVSAHVGGVLRNFAGRDGADDDSPLAEVPVVVDGDELEFLVSRLVTREPEQVQQIVLTHSYEAGELTMVHKVVVDVITLTPDLRPTWQLVPQPRLGTFVDHGKDTPDPVTVSTE